MVIMAMIMAIMAIRMAIMAINTGNTNGHTWQMIMAMHGNDNGHHGNDNGHNGNNKWQ